MKKEKKNPKKRKMKLVLGFGICFILLLLANPGEKMFRLSEKENGVCTQGYGTGKGIGS